jgi:L-ribulose-5-phosphate 4-epimerase
MTEKERLKRLREDVYRANMEIVDKGLVIFTFGNVSGIDRASGIVAIKPSGVDYSELSPANMVLLDLQGNIVEGDFNPSSDTKTHLKLYNAFEEIGGVVHTHSRYASSWAQAGKPLPCFGTTHADYFYGEIPCTDVISDGSIARDYEDETGALIVNTFRERDYRSMKAVLVACHGPFTWGKDVGEAVFISAALEDVARMGFLSVTLNSDVKNIKQTLLDKHYLRKHGKDAYYGQGGGRSI